jgi:hypothetical protein
LADGNVYCTTCDNTHPPSNCTPREPVVNKGGDTTNPKNGGGVLSNHDGSSGSGGSKSIDPSKINEGGTYSDRSSGSSKSIDPNKINSGIGFNQ